MLNIDSIHQPITYVNQVIIKGNEKEKSNMLFFNGTVIWHQIQAFCDHSQYFQEEPPSLITSSPLLSLLGILSMLASPLLSPKSPYKSLSLARLLDAEVFLLPSLCGLERESWRAVPTWL